MGMNLSDFGSQILKEKMAQQNLETNINGNFNKKNNSPDSNNNTNNKENMADQINSMKNMSEGDLNKKLWEEVNKSKNNGTFDYEKLSKTVEGFKGMMPQESYNNLKKLLEQIK